MSDTQTPEPFPGTGPFNLEELHLSKRSPVCCVYVLVHQDGVYVGGTTNLYARLKNHRSMLKHGRHFCRPLQAAFDRVRTLSVQIFLADPVDLTRLETELLKNRRDARLCVFNGGGDDAASPTRGLTVSAERRRKISESLVGKSWAPVTKEEKLSFAQAVSKGKRAKARPVVIDGQRYAGIQDAAQKLGLTYCTVRFRVTRDRKGYEDWYQI